MSSKQSCRDFSRQNDREMIGFSKCAAQPRSADESPHYDVYVSPLPPNITENQLRSHFGAFGTIKAVDIVRQSSSAKFVYAFVRYSLPSEARCAVSVMNSSMYLGSPIKVDLTHDKHQRQGVARGRGLLSRAYPENAPCGLRGKPVSPTYTDTSLKDIFSPCSRPLSRAVLSKPTITGNILSSFGGMITPYDRQLQSCTESDPTLPFPASDKVPFMEETSKESGYQSFVTTTAGFSSSNSSPVQSTAQTPPACPPLLDPSPNISEDEIEFSTSKTCSTETVENVASSLGKSIACTDVPPPPPLVETNTKDIDETEAAPKRAGRGRGAILAQLLDEIGSDSVGQSRVHRMQEVRVSKQPLPAGRGRVLKELLAKLCSEAAPGVTDTVANEASARPVERLSVDPCESLQSEVVQDGSVRSQRRIKLAATFTSQAQSQPTTHLENPHSSPPALVDQTQTAPPSQPKLYHLLAGENTVVKSVCPSTLQPPVLLSPADSEMARLNPPSTSGDASEIKDLHQPTCSSPPHFGTLPALRYSPEVIKILPLLEDLPPLTEPPVPLPSQELTEDLAHKHSSQPQGSGSPPFFQSENEPSVPRQYSADLSQYSQNISSQESLSQHSAQSQDSYSQVVDQIKESVHSSTPPLLAAATGGEASCQRKAEEDSSLEVPSTEDDDDEDREFSKTRKGRTSKQMEKRIAIMQRNIHRWQVELKRTVHKNNVMKVQVEEELKEVDTDNISRLTPEKYQEFDRVIDLQSNFVMECALLEMNARLREEISTKGEQHYAGDKLALLELRLELEEARVRDDLHRAKLENKALNAKLEYFL